MKIPFVTFEPLEKELDTQIRAAFERVYSRSWYIEGEEDKNFEENFASYCGTNYAVGCGNGLDSLMLSLKALGIGTGDEVIVPSNTYIATALAVTYTGATPVFVEPDIKTFDIDPSRIEDSITPKTKAIMPVHLYGQPCDMDPILAIGWMHDDDVVYFMKADFKNKTLSDCEKFIKDAQNCTQNLHMAVADSKDNYMGTVSLKNIENNSAEFAITMRKAAMGKGYAREGMKAILDKGFKELGLDSIYWCVSPENKRAVRFYDKNGYQRINIDSQKIGEGTAQRKYPNISGISPQTRSKSWSEDFSFSNTIEYRASFVSKEEQSYGGER